MKIGTRALLLCLGTLMVVALVGCGGVANTIYGYVVDDLGAGLGGITVTLTGGATLTTTTLASGYFGFATVDSGSYTLSADDPAAANEWQFSSRSVLVTALTWDLGIIRGFKAFELSGTVVDSRDALLAGVPGAEVTLTLRSNSAVTYSATTDASGVFQIDVPDMSAFVAGEYDVTGSLAGYFVAPKTVSLTTAAGDVGDVQAFALSADEEYGLSFILAWETAQDLDLHLSFPDADPGVANTFSATSTPYFDDFTGSRDQVYHAQKGPFVVGLNDAVYMDRDDLDGYGPETINLIWITQGTSRGSALDTDVGTGLSVFDPGTYDYYGSAELYVNAWPDGTYLTQLTGETSVSAGARVYCIQTLPIDDTLPAGTAGNQEASLLGVYTIPEYTTIQSASVLRVLMFKSGGGEFFMIVPDITVIPDGPNDGSTFRSVGVSGGIIGVRGKASR